MRSVCGGTTYAMLLCHLAPLAKAYEFTMYIGDIVHTTSTRQEVFHPYKEYFGENIDLDPSELYMSKNPEVEYKCETLRTLAGVNIAEPKLLELATEMMLKDDGGLMDLEPLEDHDIVGEGVDLRYRSKPARIPRKILGYKVVTGIACKGIGHFGNDGVGDKIRRP
ncbi:hypothetical protein B0H11DRAFT_1927958 [Mycena galericulata]|nr:hypothetical protein B0H11DRAFT_1927958 [Mycena galericulata]